MIKWIIENYDNSDSLKRLEESIKNNKMEVDIVPLSPFVLSNYYSTLNKDNINIFYGTLHTAKRIQKNNFPVTMWCNFKELSCHRYYNKYSKYLLNSDYIMLPLTELIRQQELVFSLYHVNNKIFIRPDEGNKSFVGGLFDRKIFETDIKYIIDNCCVEPEGVICLISLPKDIKREYRCVIIDNKLISYSLYKDMGNLVEKIVNNKELENYVDEILNDITITPPEDAYVMDIALTAKEFKLLELNSFSCSGLYACNTDAIVLAIKELIQKDFSQDLE